jgi:hypothetical protein
LQRGPAWFQVGNRYRYSREAIDAFLNSGKGRTAA